MLRNLNTSYVEVKQKITSGQKTFYVDLNTSYVEVKRRCYFASCYSYCYLNTSYVEVKHLQSDTQHRNTL